MKRLLMALALMPLMTNARTEIHAWQGGGITPAGCPGETINAGAISQYYDSNWWKEHSVWHGLQLVEGQKAEVTVKIMTSDPAGADMYCHVLTAEEYQYFNVGNRRPSLLNFQNHSVCSIGQSGNGATWSFTITAGVTTPSWASFSVTGWYGHFNLRGEGRNESFGSDDERVYIVLSPSGGQSTYTVGYSITCKVTPKEDDGTYSIVYMPGTYGGRFTKYLQKPRDTPVTLAGETFTRSGYVQTGWSMSDGGAKAYDLGQVYSKGVSIRLYPYCTANTYSIYYELGSGGYFGDHCPESVKFGEAFAVSAPTRLGFVFAGWTVKRGADGIPLSATWGIDANPSTLLVTEWGAGATLPAKCMNGESGDVYFKNLTFGKSATLVANWTQDYRSSYGIVYKPGVTASGPERMTVKIKGRPAILKGAVFTRSGYVQTGWAKVDGGVKWYDLGGIYTTDASHTLYPYWSVKSKLIVKPNSTKYGSVSGSGTYASGKLVQLKATAKEGYVFTGWYTDKDCTKKLNPEGYDNRKSTIKITMPAKTMTVYAKFNSVATDKSGLEFSDSTKKLAKTAKAYAANAKVSLALGFSSKSYPKVAATGLPDGLSIDALTGKITGTVKKPGAYTVKVTVTSAAGNKITQNVKIDVKAPSWAYGTFYGYGIVVVSGKEIPVMAKFTSTEVGKVSGKVTYKGTACAFTANYASATDAEARFTVSFTAGGVAFKSAMSIKQKTSGLTYTRAHALKADSFELEMQKVVPLVQTGKSLEGMIGKSYTFKYGYANAGLTKSGDKLVVKFADKDVVKLSGIAGGKSFSGLSASVMACGKSKTETTTKYKLNVPVVAGTVGYYRLLTFKVTIDTATKKVTKVEKAFAAIE